MVDLSIVMLVYQRAAPIKMVNLGMVAPIALLYNSPWIVIKYLCIYIYIYIYSFLLVEMNSHWRSNTNFLVETMFE